MEFANFKKLQLYVKCCTQDIESLTEDELNNHIVCEEERHDSTYNDGNIKNTKHNDLLT